MTGVGSSSKGCTDKARRTTATRPALLLLLLLTLLVLVLLVKRRRIIIVAVCFVLDAGRVSVAVALLVSSSSLWGVLGFGLLATTGKGGRRKAATARALCGGGCGGGVFGGRGGNKDVAS